MFRPIGGNVTFARFCHIGWDLENIIRHNAPQTDPVSKKILYVTDIFTQEEKQFIFRMMPSGLTFSRYHVGIIMTFHEKKSAAISCERHNIVGYLSVDDISYIFRVVHTDCMILSDPGICKGIFLGSEQASNHYPRQWWPNSLMRVCHRPQRFQYSLKRPVWWSCKLSNVSYLRLEFLCVVLKIDGNIRHNADNAPVEW